MIEKLLLKMLTGLVDVFEKRGNHISAFVHDVKSENIPAEFFQDKDCSGRFYRRYSNGTRNWSVCVFSDTVI